MNALPTEPPAEGWRASLELRFDSQERRTRLAHRAHRGPLLVQRAFYPESAPDSIGPSTCSSAEPCHVYLIHPPGGVVSGDELSLEVEVQADAHALLTTPAAGKFYRQRDARVARLSQRLRVDDGVLEWLPQENIYYPDCAVELNTVLRLTGGARVIAWEIGCLGLPASHATLGQGRIRQCFELWLDGAPVWLERLTLDRACLQPRWGLAGHSALGSWIAYPAQAQHLERARSVALEFESQHAELTLACTLVDKTLCCRGYAARADRLKQCFIDLWKALRFDLLGRTATTPRIWMT
jgi:urease accessory protein